MSEQVRQATPSECVTIARQYLDQALEKSREGWSTDEVEALVRSARHWLPTALTEWTERLEAAEAAVERVRALADGWASWTTMWQGIAAAELREALEGCESHAEAPGSADRSAGGVDGRSEGREGRSGGMG